MKSSGDYRYAVIGDWHLAFVQASCLSSLGHKTVLVNPLQSVAPWNEFPKSPITEPGLPEMIAGGLKNRTLAYENGITPAWKADFVWVAIDTPVNDRDEVDLAPLERIFEQLSKHSGWSRKLVISSQVPAGFCDSIKKKYGFSVVYVPENLRLGKGIETFMKADWLVLGASDPGMAEELKKDLAQVETQFVVCSPVTAEMIKHSTNVFLAMSISYANELAKVGSEMGADMQTVARTLKIDRRIGKFAYVAPGLGFAGGTLPRDLRVIQGLGEKLKVETPLVDAVLEVNASITASILKHVRSYLEGLQGKRVLIVGYPYKTDADTLRRSLSVDLAKDFKKAGTALYGFDPVMNGKDLRALQGLIQHCDTWDSIPQDLDAVVVMTPRNEFRVLPWPSLGAGKKNRKTLVFDACAFLDPAQFSESEFVFKQIWEPLHG